MEATVRTMEDINKDHLMKAYNLFRTPIKSEIEAEGGYGERDVG